MFSLYMFEISQSNSSILGLLILSLLLYTFCTQDLLVESGVVGPSSVNGVMSGKFYNGSVRCHKIMHEALEMVRFQSFMDSCSEERVAEIESLLDNVRDGFPKEEFYNCLESPDLKELIDDYERFILTVSKQSPTFTLWSTYIEITGLFLINTKRTFKVHRSSI